MTKPTFSIIIPAYNREKILPRALNSLYAQTYDKDLYEIIVVDDGSTDETRAGLSDMSQHAPAQPNFIFESFTENRGRIAARNKGLELAKNDFICWLDSDDEYVSTYLEVYAKAISENPGTKIFTGGTVVYDEQALCSRLRDAFMPGVREDGRGCLPFKSGGVSTGGFVFDRGLAREVGFLPEARVPYGSADSLPAIATQKYPELEALYGKNADGQWLPFGNPFGDDWLYFYLLTRNNVPKSIGSYAPYLQHVRH